MNSLEFVDKLIDIATHYKTLYVMGCFGAPMTPQNKNRYITNYSYNAKSDRANMIKNADNDCFGFDCVCLIKGVVWGWCGDVTKTYGGAVYQSNGLKDISIAKMLNDCSDVSQDFTKIEMGEIVFLNTEHVGVYIGNGQVVECTPAWKNGVQITQLKARNWTCHGKANFIDYERAVEIKNAVDVVLSDEKVNELLKELVNRTGYVLKAERLLDNL